MKNLTEQTAKAALKPNKRPRTESVRVFFALWPNRLIQQQLHAIAKQLQPQSKGRLMRAETLHMTLQFIGNIPLSLLPKIIAAADKVTVQPFVMQLAKSAYWKHNRIAYATLASNVPLLDELVSSLKTALSEQGVTYADQKFSPHVTLLRNAEYKLQIEDFPPIEWQVDSFVLVESALTDQGAQYKILRRCIL